MMRLVLLVASVVVAACASRDRASDTASAGATSIPGGADRAVTAAGVSNAIASNPAAADSILTANGYSRESFQQAMYEIASDSVEAAKYAAVKK